MRLLSCSPQHRPLQPDSPRPPSVSPSDSLEQALDEALNFVAARQPPDESAPPSSPSASYPQSLSTQPGHGTPRKLGDDVVNSPDLVELAVASPAFANSSTLSQDSQCNLTPSDELADALTSALLGIRGPHHPVPSSWFCAAPAPTDSIEESPQIPSTPLRTIISNMLLMCDEGDISCMKQQMANLQKLCEDVCSSAGIPVTTACSGTDLVIPALSTFFSVFDSLYGDVEPATSRMGVDHLWSCECTPWKSEWIRNVMGGSTVFKDVKELGSRVAEVHGGDTKPVLKGFLHATGFSCKSVSAMHRHRTRFKRCIKQRKGSTGSTFHCTFKFLRRDRPLLVWLENVAAFRGRNLKLVKRMLRSLGYVVISVILDLLLHGTPCRRRRVWILAVLAPKLSLSDEACDSLQKRAEELESVLRQSPLPLSMFLHDDVDEPDEKPQERGRRGTKRKAQHCGRSINKKPKVAKWVTLHNVVWKEYKHTTGSEPPKVLPPHLQHLETSRLATAREIDVGLMDFMKHASAYVPGSAERIVDLSQSITRAPATSGFCPTLTPGSRAHLLSRARPRALSGLERLRLQGFSPDMATGRADAVKQFSERQLADLAGNAFSATHVAIAMLLSLVLFKMPQQLEDLDALQREAAFVDWLASPSTFVD